MNLPTLNMIGWSILDYELAFDGIRQVNDATVWLQNQPRAENASTKDYHPGAAFIVDLGESWCSDTISDLVDSLQTVRFADPADDDRRIMLLLQYETQWGSACSPLADILAMVELQRKLVAA